MTMMTTKNNDDVGAAVGNDDDEKMMTTMLTTMETTMMMLVMVTMMLPVMIKSIVKTMYIIMMMKKIKEIMIMIMMMMMTTHESFVYCIGHILYASVCVAAHYLAMVYLPRHSGTGGGLAFYVEPVLQKTLQFLLEILFLRLLRYVKYVFPMMVILQCSLVFTVPHLVDRIS